MKALEAAELKWNSDQDFRASVEVALGVVSKEIRMLTLWKNLMMYKLVHQLDLSETCCLGRRQANISCFSPLIRNAKSAPKLHTVGIGALLCHLHVVEHMCEDI